MPVSPSAAPRVKGFDAALRLVLLTACLALFALLMSQALYQPVGSFYLLAFLIGLINPWWALLAIMLLAPLLLLGPGSTHRLVQTELFLLGAVAGHVIRRGDKPNTPFDCEDEKAQPVPVPPAGLWPHLGWILGFGVLAAALPGFQIASSPEPTAPTRVALEPLLQGIYGYPTLAWWPWRAAFNWLTGLALCWIAFRWATPPRVRRLLLYAGGGMAVACLIGLGERLGVWSLDGWRPPNPDGLHRKFQRLTGLAGHAGWMAEWIVVAWPGLLLLGGPGKRRKWLMAASLVVVGLTLLLTLARAAWLGALLALVVFAVLHLRPRRIPWKGLGAGIAVAGGLAAVALLVASDSLVFRLSRLTDFRDRLNYVASTLHLVRESPWGGGLGMHSLMYDSWFAPFHRFWQFDHTTAHNTWLHLLVEQGPFQMAMLAAGGLVLFGSMLRAWRRADPERRALLACLLLVFAGLAAESLAQYLPLIRVVELSVWVLAGCAIRLCRDIRMQALGRRSPTGAVASASGRTSWAGVPLLVAGGAAACLVGLYHARRDAAHPYPRPLVLEVQPGKVEIWTDRVWRFPLEADWCGIEFNLIASRYPQDVEVLLPDNPPYSLHLEPGEQKGLWFAFYPVRPAERFTPLRWMEIRCARTWTPALTDPGATDHRPLGIYVFGLHPFYCDDDPRRPESQTWTESVGGIVPRLPPPAGGVPNPGDDGAGGSNAAEALPADRLPAGTPQAGPGS